MFLKKTIQMYIKAAQIISGLFERQQRADRKVDIFSVRSYRYYHLSSSLSYSIQKRRARRPEKRPLGYGTATYTKSRVK